METNSEMDNSLPEKWPGWPGFTVFRLIVPSKKVKNGVFLKKLMEETRATVRVIDGPVTSPDRVILIYAKEEPEAALSPAMNAAIRIFKLVNGLTDTDGNVTASAAAGTAPCLTRLLVPATQGLSLIGRGGCVIKVIQEGCGARLRILPHGELPAHADVDERIVELQGETFKVLRALEAVVEHLRKYLVDQSILPLFEKNYNEPAATRERQVDAEQVLLLEYSEPAATRERQVGAEQVLLLEYNEPATTRKRQVDAQSNESVRPAVPPTSLRDDCSPSLKKDSKEDHRISSSTTGVCIGPFVTKVTRTLHIPYACAEDIVGVLGANIDYIRRVSGAEIKAEVKVAQIKVISDKIKVEIKGTAQEVQTAKELIQAFIGYQTDLLAGRDSDSFSNSN